MEERHQLSRRERQIMDLVYSQEEVTASSLEKDLPDPPSNATIRSLLKTMEQKGLLIHHKENRRFVYRSAKPVERASQSAVKHLVKTFFQGSSLGAISAILDQSEIRHEELDELAQLIEAAKREGK